MPLFVINKIPVALTFKTDRMLREEIYGLERIISSYIKVHGKKDNTYKLQKKLLYKKYRENPDGFMQEFAKFNLQGEEASANLWDLIYDYCAYYGSGYPSDARDILEELSDDYNGDNFFYPEGRVFYLNHYSAPYNWRWKFVKRKTGKIVRTVIDTRSVVRVVGTVADFSIIYKDKVINCSEIFEVLPIK